jgi:NADH:ubiquinone oxidoreductase subunit 5 (subunit L)/multisubunit Na+/H+ antiporter MnhA subunit
MFVIVTFSTYHTFDITSINAQVYLHNHYFLTLLGVNIDVIELCAIFVLGAAFIKSAQFGGHI